jgi:hypothetical protein
MWKGLRAVIGGACGITSSSAQLFVKTFDVHLDVVAGALYVAAIQGLQLRRFEISLLPPRRLTREKNLFYIEDAEHAVGVFSFQ